MKNFSSVLLICFFLVHIHNSNRISSFLKEKTEDENEIAENILAELKGNDKDVSFQEKEAVILDKDDFSLDHNQMNCEEIKKLGQQKTFCKKKFPADDKIQLLNCMKTFCEICCGAGDISCIKYCKQSHSLFPDHDPEEMLLSVCSLKKMTDSFKSVCDTLLVNKKTEEYSECFSNICFDCCSNELGITDSKDSKMKKCLSSCMGRTKIEKKLNSPHADSSGKK